MTFPHSTGFSNAAITTSANGNSSTTTLNIQPSTNNTRFSSINELVSLGTYPGTDSDPGMGIGMASGYNLRPTTVPMYADPPEGMGLSIESTRTSVEDMFRIQREMEYNTGVNSSNPVGGDTLGPIDAAIPKKILSFVGEKFNSEGFHSEHPQIVGITEYIPLFQECDPKSDKSIYRVSPSLKKIISRNDLQATGAHDLLEMQRWVRNSIVDTVNELFKIFYKKYTPDVESSDVESSDVELEEDLDPRIIELFEFENFLEITQQVDLKSESFKNVKYNFNDNNVEKEDIVKSLEQYCPPSYSYYIDFVTKFIETNPYVSSIINYYVLRRFAYGLIEVMKLIVEKNQSLLDSFYIEVINNNDYINSEANSAKDNKLIDAYNDAKNNDGGDKSIRSIFRPEVTPSNGILRLIKVLHAGLAGVLINRYHPFEEDDEYASGASYQGSMYTRSYNYLINSRVCREFSFIHDAHYAGFKNHPSANLFNDYYSESDYKHLHSYTFDHELASSAASHDELASALIPLIFDLRNSASLPKTKGAQSDLMIKHLYGSNDKVDITLARSNPYSAIPSAINLDYDPIKIWTQFQKCDLSKSAIDNLEVGKVIYQDDPVSNKTILMCDNASNINDDLANINVVDLKNYAFSISKTLTGEATADTLNKLKAAQNGIDAVIKDIYDNYDLLGIRELGDTDTNINPEARLGHSYMNNFFRTAAAKLLAHFQSMEQGLYSDSLTTDSAKRAINTLYLYCVAGDNDKFSKAIFGTEAYGRSSYSAGAGSDADRSTDGQSHYMRTGNEHRFTIPRGDEGHDALMSSGQYATLGTNTDQKGAHFNLTVDEWTVRSYNSVLPYSDPAGKTANECEFRRLEGAGSNIFNAHDGLLQYLYYNVLPGTRNTIGTGDHYEDYPNYKLGTNGQYHDAEWISFYDKAEHFLDEEKEVVQTSTKGSGRLNSEIVSIATSTGDGMFTDVVGSFSRRNGNQNVSTGENFSCVWEAEMSFLKNKLGTEKVNKIFGSAAQDLVSNYSWFGHTSDKHLITPKNGIGSSSMSRVYLMHMILVKILSNNLKIKLALGPINGNNNNTNNRDRSVFFQFDLQTFKGVYDALMSNDKDANNTSTSYNTSFDNVRNNMNVYFEYARHQERMVLTCLYNLIKIRNFYYSLEKRINTAFDLTSEENIQSFLDTFPEEIHYFDSFSYDQRKLASFLNLTLMTPSSKNLYLPAQKDITDVQLDAMKKYFAGKSGMYNFVASPGTPIKKQPKRYIIHFGITNALIDTLREEMIIQENLDASQLDADQKAEQLAILRTLSIIRIDLYRKNLIDNNDVLMANYFFDTNKFMIENTIHEKITDYHASIGVTSGHSWDVFNQLHPLFDFKNENQDFGKVLWTNKDLIMSNPDSNISSLQVDQLFENHITDHYLKLYCKSVMGMDFDSDVFVNKKAGDLLLNTEIQSLDVLQDYQSAFKTHLDDLLVAGNNDPSFINERFRIEKEAKRSLFFSMEKMMKRVIYPKVFDRVFSVLFSPNGHFFGDDAGVSLDRMHYTVTLTKLRAEYPPDPPPTFDFSGIINEPPEKAPDNVTQASLSGLNSGPGALNPYGYEPREEEEELTIGAPTQHVGVTSNITSPLTNGSNIPYRKITF